MNVLHVIPSVSPSMGGPSEVIRTLCPALAAAGCEVDVISTGTGRTVGEYAVSGVTYREFAMQSRFYSFSLPLASWMSKNALRYSVVHVHGVFSWTSTAAAWIARDRRVPYIVRPYGTLDRWCRQHRRPWAKKASFRVVEQPLLQQAAAVQYTTEEEQRQAADLGFKHTPVVVPNPVHLAASSIAHSGALREQYPALRYRTVVLFLSRLDHVKGLELLLPAFAAVRARRPEAALAIAGSGSSGFEEFLRSEVARLGIQSDVTWLGFLTGAAKWAALADADLFALPSHSESFGVAAAEAMACGVPIVITKGVGIHDLVQRAEAGLVVPADAPALAGGLEQMIASPELRARMGANGRRLAHSEFSVDSVCRRMLQLYRSVATAN